MLVQPKIAHHLSKANWHLNNLYKQIMQSNYKMNWSGVEKENSAFSNISKVA